jgi:small subunit ribosomal protein S3
MIDYGQYEARTTFGRIGVKVWIYKGDAIGTRTEREQAEAALRQQRRERPQRPRRSGSSGTTGTSTEAGRAAATGSDASVEAPATDSQAVETAVGVIEAGDTSALSAPIGDPSVAEALTGDTAGDTAADTSGDTVAETVDAPATDAGTGEPVSTETTEG